jgi:hypothetical protein
MVFSILHLEDSISLTDEQLDGLREHPSADLRYHYLLFDLFGDDLKLFDRYKREYANWWSTVCETLECEPLMAFADVGFFKLGNLKAESAFCSQHLPSFLKWQEEHGGRNHSDSREFVE